MLASQKIAEQRSQLEEKNRAIEKSVIIHEFYEQLKKEHEEILQQRNHYKERLEQISTDIDLHASSQNILKQANSQFDTLKQKLFDEVKKNREL